MNPKYPEINVQLVGEDGNAFSIIGRVTQALREHKVLSQEIANFREEAMSGDYDKVLITEMQWVNTDGEDDNDLEWEEDDQDDDWTAQRERLLKVLPSAADFRKATP